MNAPNDNTAPRGLRGWWASPTQSGARRWINPWEYRHLRASGATRLPVAASWPSAASCSSRTAPTDGRPCSWFLGR
jgi:hypothetical protein